MKKVSYKSIRPFFFAAVIFAGIFSFGLFIYKDFMTPPEAIQPTFDIQNVESKKKTTQEKAAYSVPPTHPKNVIINELNINANIIPLGTLKNNAIDTPKTAWDVGWYSSSAQPGSSGAIVLDGHVNDALYTPGVFYKLHTIQAGATIQLQRGDDKMFTYEVKTVEQLPSGSLDMKKVLSPIDSSKEGLNIITCGGTYDSSAKTYTDRVVVYATRVA